MGRALIELLLSRGHAVHALARPGSETRVAKGAIAVTGDALDAATFARAIPPRATLVHLVGTPHPSPAKAAEFERVDRVSIGAATSAAASARAAHFIYVSVAHPAPVMHAYIVVREQGEALVGATGIPATILRPWYVLGPGHYWPYLLVPFYALGRLFPAHARAGDPSRTRDAATNGDRVDRRGGERAVCRRAHRRRAGHPAGTIAHGGTMSAPVNAWKVFDARTPILTCEYSFGTGTRPAICARWSLSAKAPRAGNRTPARSRSTRARGPRPGCRRTAAFPRTRTRRRARCSDGCRGRGVPSKRKHTNNSGCTSSPGNASGTRNGRASSGKNSWPPSG